MFVSSVGKNQNSAECGCVGIRFPSQTAKKPIRKIMKKGGEDQSGERGTGMNCLEGNPSKLHPRQKDAVTPKKRGGIGSLLGRARPPH